MKIVIDSNVFVSSFYYGGNPRLVVERVLNELDELFVSDDVLDEIEDVLNRPKFKGNKSDIEKFMDSLKEVSILMNPSERIDLSRDKKDNKYIECAVAADADFIVSGDVHLLELKEHGKIKILKAKEYLDAVG
jgi:putative PIN family toxin of toxin-antitoxin system